MKIIKIKEETFGIKHARDFYNSLKDELIDNDEVVLDFAGVKRIDLSIAQIIIAAGRSARKNKKTIKLKSVSENLKYQMIIGGLKL